jgi:hypothetical protein
MAAPAFSTIVDLKKQRRIKTCRPPRLEGAQLKDRARPKLNEAKPTKVDAANLRMDNTNKGRRSRIEPLLNMKGARFPFFELLRCKPAKA